MMSRVGFKAIAVGIGLLMGHATFANPVVIKDDIEITAEDLGKYVLDRVPERSRSDFFRQEDAVHQLAESLLLIRALAEEASQSDALDMDLIEWQVELHRDRLMMEQYLAAIVKSQTDGMDWEAAAREAYLAEPEAYELPEQVQASHVLIKAEERSEEEAEALAEEVLRKLKDGQDIKLLAAQYSEDPSARTNLGALGIISRGQTVPEFEEAVFALREPGEITGPVKTDFGYHVIELTRYQPASKREFDEVKDEIIAQLQTAIPTKIRQDKVVAARSSEDIEADHEALQALLEKFRAGDFD